MTRSIQYPWWISSWVTHRRYTWNTWNNIYYCTDKKKRCSPVHFHRLINTPETPSSVNEWPRAERIETLPWERACELRAFSPMLRWQPQLVPLVMHKTHLEVPRIHMHYIHLFTCITTASLVFSHSVTQSLTHSLTLWLTQFSGPIGVLCLCSGKRNFVSIIMGLLYCIDMHYVGLCGWTERFPF